MILEEKDFERISAHARAAFALNLDSSKLQMVGRRLASRVREVGCTDFSQYADYLDENEAERMSLTSTLTTNTTHFFRESHHFETMEKNWLPELVATARSGGRVRIWSAASSRGQEPYSIAMTICEACPEASSLDIHILATDIDQVVLEQAKKGRYSREETTKIPAKQLQKYFEMDGETYLVKPNLRKIVSFARLNLPAEWPFRGKFDIIFCRNVAIYFDSDVQDRLWRRMSSVLNTGGLLCIGHSERIREPGVHGLEPLGKTSYQKLTTVGPRNEK